MLVITPPIGSWLPSSFLKGKGPGSHLDSPAMNGERSVRETMEQDALTTQVPRPIHADGLDKMPA